jgi:hypothetical protein
MLRPLYSLASRERGRRHVKGTNGSLTHPEYEKRARNGDPLRQDADLRLCAQTLKT